MATLFHGCLYTTTESVKNINDNIFYNLSVKRLQIYKHQLTETSNLNIARCTISIHDLHSTARSRPSISGESMHCVSNRLIN